MGYQVMDTTNGDIISPTFDKKIEAEIFIESRGIDYDYCEIVEIKN